MSRVLQTMKVQMDILSLSVFVKIADTRSFVEAGRALGISASGVGKSIARLEKKLTVRLFHRSTRSLTLTAEGEVFLDRARHILAEMTAAATELSQSISVPQGRLRIGLPLIGEPFLSLLTDFKLAYPEIELDLEFDNRKVDVIEEGFDAVIRSGALPDSLLSARSLGSFRSMIAGTPAYFARNGMPRTPGDLKDHVCIHLRNRQTGKLLDWNLRESPEEAGFPIPKSVICNSNEARVHFVTRGVGIAYLSDFDVWKELKNGEVMAALAGYTGEVNTFHLLWPSGRHVPSKLRVFIDFMVARSPLRRAKV